MAAPHLPQAPHLLPTRRRHSALWWIVTTLDAGFILFVSVIPITVRGASTPFLDKAVHVCEYGFFAWLLAQALRATGETKQSLALKAWVIAASYGALIEGIQAVIPWRSAELGDALANALGAALGVWLSQHLMRPRSTVHSPR